MNPSSLRKEGKMRIFSSSCRLRACILTIAVVIAGSAPAQSGETREYQAFYGPKGDPHVYCSGPCGTGVCCVFTPLAPNT